MVRHKCPASRTIYVPVDPAIHMAIVVPNPEKPHNHPILPATKASITLKDLYRKCIQATGIVGSSVRTVDNGVFQFYICQCTYLFLYIAQSTRLLLDGKTPSLIAPALQNNRVKHDILRAEKKKAYP